MKKQYVHYDGIVFLIVLLIVFLSKLSVLTTPYYWDEIGWINSPHWLSRQNLLRALPGLHPLGTFFGHPPGLHVSMALLFKIFGESIWLSHFFIVCFSFAGVYFTYLLGKDRFGRFVGIFSALFLFFTPMYFAQSGMYLGDVPVAAMGVMSIYFGLKKRYLPYLIASIYLVFIKETGAAIILAYLLYFVCKEFTKERQFYLQVLKYSIPLWLITVFMIWQKITAGKFLGIYSFEFDIYKHTTEAVFQDFITILKWIFVYQHRYIFTILILLFIILFPKRALRKELLLFLLIFVLAVLPFSYFMLLPRYLLPFLPYLCIAGAWALCELISSVKIRTALGLAITALFISSLSGSISYGNNEWNMKYVKIVNMYKSMCQYVEREFPNSSILTMFPFNGAMRKPYLGYVTRPLNAVALTKNIRENKCDLILFSAPSDPKRISLLMDFAKKDKMVLVKRIEEEGIVSELYRKPQSNEQGTISMRNN